VEFILHISLLRNSFFVGSSLGVLVSFSNRFLHDLWNLLHRLSAICLLVLLKRNLGGKSGGGRGGGR
jgi:hypothetical protein